MIDAIRIKADVPLPLEIEAAGKEPIIWNGLLFKPMFIKQVVEGKDPEVRVIGYKATHRKLLISWYLGYLFIRGSIHTFYKGNNWSDFNLKELRDAIYQLGNLLKVPPKEMRLLRYEFGLNLIWHEPVKHLLSKMRLILWKKFDVLKNHENKWWGLKRFFAKYEIKLYDKVAQVNLSKRKVVITGRLLRVEIVFKGSSKVDKNLMLSDLGLPQVLEQLYKHLQKSIRDITFDSLGDVSGLPRNHRQLIFAGRDPDYWLTEGEIDSEWIKDVKKLFKNLMARFDDGSKQLLMDSISDKFHSLIGAGSTVLYT